MRTGYIGHPGNRHRTDIISPEQLKVEMEFEPESVLASESILALIEEEADQPGIVLIEPYGGDESG